MPRPVPPLKILLIEDEALLVMDLEYMVADAGHYVIGDVASVGELAQWKSKSVPDLVLIDIQLAEETNGLDASRLVKDRWANTCIVFVTANPLKVPPGYSGSYGVIPKPFSRQMMMGALAYLSDGICSPPPAQEAPAGFIEFAEFRNSWNNSALPNIIN